MKRLGNNWHFLSPGWSRAVACFGWRRSQRWTARGAGKAFQHPCSQPPSVRWTSSRSSAEVWCAKYCDVSWFFLFLSVHGRTTFWNNTVYLLQAGRLLYWYRLRTRHSQRRQRKGLFFNFFFSLSSKFIFQIISVLLMCYLVRQICFFFLMTVSLAQKLTDEWGSLGPVKFHGFLNEYLVQNEFGSRWFMWCLSRSVLIATP